VLVDVLFDEALLVDLACYRACVSTRAAVVSGGVRPGREWSVGAAIIAWPGMPLGERRRDLPDFLETTGSWGASPETGK
jgi:hypothetical protein